MRVWTGTTKIEKTVMKQVVCFVWFGLVFQ